MILFDYNQVAISNFMVGSYVMDSNIDTIRHMILTSIHKYKGKFGNRFGRIVICSDGRHYWRKTIFPYYKVTRKKNRDDSPIDWNSLFNTLNQVRDEIRDYLPYQVIHLEEVEADDIIAVSAKKFCQHEDVLILSSDKDFCQLQKYPNIYQYSTIQKKAIVEKDPERFLKEHIIRGDAGDGVPNILSPDNCFAANTRQSTLRQSKVDEWINSGKDLSDIFESDAKLAANYNRNRLMVDLDCIPDNIQNRILEQYETPFAEDRSKIFKYFMEKRLKLLQEHITEF